MRARYPRPVRILIRESGSSRLHIEKAFGLRPNTSGMRECDRYTAGTRSRQPEEELLRDERHLKQHRLRACLPRNPRRPAGSRLPVSGRSSQSG